MPAGDHWTLDKRVPLALVLTIILQTAGGVWWAATLTSTTDEHGRRLLSMERSIEIMADVKAMMRDVGSLQIKISDVAGHVAQIDSKLAGSDAERAAMRASIDRLERQYDRLARRPLAPGSSDVGPLRPPIVDGDADAAVILDPSLLEGVTR